MTRTLIVRDASSLITLGSGPLRGSALTELDVREGQGVAWSDGIVSEIGSVDGGDVDFDASGCTVVPGFVDPHTHLPFFGWRADEDAARLTGVRYEDLHKGEGGIFRSARMLADADDEQVLAFSGRLAEAMLRTGTTTFEMKSGYGLSVEAELRQLRLAKRLGEQVQQDTVTTCLAAHAVPNGMSQGEWVGVAAQELLPAAVEEGLASACDIFVESIAFALEHAARLTKAAEALGLRMRVHADQLTDNQTGSFAARWGFASADHLNHASQGTVADMAESDTAAVLLPGATFTLRQSKKPPARDLVDSGALVALGTDLNPGTSPISSMPFVIALACRTYGLRPMEALAAATVNAAAVLGLEGPGRIKVGEPSDAVVLDIERFEELPYRPDRNPVIAVIKGGSLVHIDAAALERAKGL